VQNNGARAGPREHVYVRAGREFSSSLRRARHSKRLEAQPVGAAKPTRKAVGRMDGTHIDRWVTPAPVIRVDGRSLGC